jgi:tRNA threonylcarbamoyladenosine biosynthesis protein TsaB
MQIAIDTSTGTASLALVGDAGILAEMSWRCGQNHTVQLLSNLSNLLKQVGVDMKSASGVIVARGPGSYNGLRVGVATAKGLAFSLDIPLVGISTLQVEAYQHSERGLPVCAVFSAGRGEIAAAIYRGRGEDWTQLVAEHVTTVEILCSQIVGPTVFCGEFIPAGAPEFRNRLGDKAIFVSSAASLRRAGYLAELGLRRLRAGDYDDPATLQPLYLRAPPITEPKHH